VESYTEKYLLYRGNDLAIQELKVPSFVYVGINSCICAIPVRTTSHGNSSARWWTAFCGLQS
jgi:hypothetical protein